MLHRILSNSISKTHITNGMHDLLIIIDES